MNYPFFLFFLRVQKYEKNQHILRWLSYKGCKLEGFNYLKLTFSILFIVRRIRCCFFLMKDEGFFAL